MDFSIEQMAAIGAVGNGIFENLGINIKDMMENNLEKYKDEEPMARWQKAMQNMNAEIIVKLPMFMRFNLLSHSIAKVKEDGHEESEIDWKHINDILEKNRNAYDFNCYDYIDSYDKFFEAASDCRVSSIIGAWYKEICKDCNKTFFMSKDEVDFFAKKELCLPKRCRACRDKRKGIVKENPKQVIRQPENKDSGETAMSIAMRKAGITSVEKYLDKVSD